MKFSIKDFFIFLPCLCEKATYVNVKMYVVSFDLGRMVLGPKTQGAKKGYFFPLVAPTPKHGAFSIWSLKGHLRAPEGARGYKHETLLKCPKLLLKNICRLYKHIFYYT